MNRRISLNIVHIPYGFFENILYVILRPPAVFSLEGWKPCMNSGHAQSDEAALFLDLRVMEPTERFQ